MSVKDARLPTYGQIAGFFLPLSLTSLIITLSHSIVNAGVARTDEPETALAAYALARSLVMLIENPMFIVRQTAASLVRSIPSFFLVQRFVYTLAIAITLTLAVIAFSPLGEWVFKELMGAPPATAAQAHAGLKILFLLPLFTVSRNLYHGVAILARQTKLVPISTAVRLVVMSVTVFILAIHTSLPGAVSASIAFCAAFMVESAVMRKKALPLLANGKNFPKKNTSETLNAWDISRFFFPLVITTFVATSFGPLINTGLARSLKPEVALAAYSVGHGLAMMVLAPLGMLHQCTLTFARSGSRRSHDMTKIFTAAFALAASMLMAAVTFSPLGPWILDQLMGVPPDVSRAALDVMRIMSLLPLLIGWREFLWGIFMQHKETKLIGAAKTANLTVVLVTLFGLLAAGTPNPANAGAWAMVAGEAVDCMIMQFYYRRSPIYTMHTAG